MAKTKQYKRIKCRSTVTSNIRFLWCVAVHSKRNTDKFYWQLLFISDPFHLSVINPCDEFTHFSSFLKYCPMQTLKGWCFRLYQLLEFCFSLFCLELDCLLSAIPRQGIFTISCWPSPLPLGTGLSRVSDTTLLMSKLQLTLLFCKFHHLPVLPFICSSASRCLPVLSYKDWHCLPSWRMLSHLFLLPSQPYFTTQLTWQTCYFSFKMLFSDSHRFLG